MRIVVQAKVIPDTLELLATIRQFNAVCNWLSIYAYHNHAWNWHRLQTETYHTVRELFGLSAAATVVAVRKVASVYQDKTSRRRIAKFNSIGSMPLYQHSYKRDGQVLIYGKRYPIVSKAILNARYEGILTFHKGKFLIYQAIEVNQPEAYKTRDFLGCDLGVTNILVDSDKTVHSSGHLYGLRKRYSKIRSRLQKKQTSSSKRLLRLRKRKERLFARDINHCISKKVVTKANDTHRGIALEELTGIRESITVRKPQRRQHYSWAFRQLRSFIEYKAMLAGVPVVIVDPRNTSRTCPECGYTSKNNRKSQSEFMCNSCGYAELADYVAARNIASRAVGNQPDAIPLMVIANSFQETGDSCHADVGSERRKMNGPPKG